VAGCLIGQLPLGCLAGDQGAEIAATILVRAPIDREWMVWDTKRHKVTWRDTVGKARNKQIDALMQQIS
jgi:hypothetical protein